MKYHSLLRRGRIVLASTIGALVLFPSLPASAALTSFSDVSSGVWYEQSAANLLHSGALDSSQTKLRPNDLATRGEIFKMLINVNRVATTNPSTPSFSDVPRGSASFQYVETTAKEGWLQGDKNCYGQDWAICKASPLEHINRAEMAMLLQRSFDLPVRNTAPRPSDVSSNDWFADAIQASADHCILLGDDSTGLVRPAALMSRAEMIVMFDRASMSDRYGVDCGDRPEAAGAISSVSVMSADTVQVVFNIDLDPNYQGQLNHYAIGWTSNGSPADITSVNVINARMLELKLGSDLRAGVEYRLTASNMRSQRGVFFNANKTFTSDKGMEGSINSVTALSPTSVSIVFSGNVDQTSAEQAWHYRVSDASGNNTVVSATLMSSNTVKLMLSSALRNQQNYTVTVDGLSGVNDMTFSDSKNFVYNPSIISLVATLHGQNAVPSVSTFTTGTGVFMLTSTGLQYDITMKRIDDAGIKGAHFNRGMEGVEGPVVHTFTFNGLRATGTWTNLTTEDRDNILRGCIYVEVDGSYYSDGRVRGQISGGMEQDCTTASDDDLSLSDQRRARAEEIWTICDERYTNLKDRNSCFQRNQGLIDRYDIPVTTVNVY